MALFPTAGARLFIGGPLAQKSDDFVAGDFTSQDWVEIKSLENLGTAGDTSEEVSIDLINEMRTKRFKGTRSAAPMELAFGLDLEDAGQIALIAAERERSDYAFKIEFDDAPMTTNGTPTTRLFIAQVASATEAYDSANNVTRLQSALWINSNLVRVAAAA
jgi:hypothetical protein